MTPTSGPVSGDPPPPHPRLVSLLVDLREAEVMEEANRLLLAGEPPQRILDSCQRGMAMVGRLYEQKRYYIAGLIMAGRIMRDMAELLEPHFQASIPGGSGGRVLLATVQGDIHYIGKNLVKVLLKCHGFTVRDLGEDVPPAEILAGVRAFDPDVVGLSALLTACFDPLRQTIAFLRANHPRGRRPPPIMIGGGATDKLVRGYVQADHWAPDAIGGVAICQKIMAGG